ncbi:XrtN system VIT domain-containing protein [Chitinophaga ginsengisoli]|uniref:XrtN system VIT domain-containing protein n=1 Tax=Chitinophaga ginsengisoli TaxID=363837 RepID=UPI0014745A29|nr:XrtN system VIT domain-containing protein [Chitinophaga ginsengisoli]
MKIIRKRFNDEIYCTGLILLAVTLIMFLIPALSPIEDELTWFFLNHAITVGYFLTLWISGRLRRGREGLHPFFLFLLMFLVSAYALNRLFPVFEVSAPWFAVMIILCAVNYFAFAFIRVVPVPVRIVMFFLLGLSLCCFLYMAIYVAPFTALGLLAFFFFGISLHALVPLLFFLYTIRLFRRSNARRRPYKLAFWSGIGITVLIVLVYTILWMMNVVEMGREYRRWSEKVRDTYLPAWLHVAAHITPNPVTGKVLRAEMVYTTADGWERPFFNFGSSLNWNEARKHDPLVMIASTLCGTTMMTDEDRIHILKFLYDSRYEAEERLWSGDDLTTTHVQTSARIWPRLRMAYTEKTVNVKNNRIITERGRWRNNQEAIYIFHLPEGAVVSSLSLWINNKEEKGLLTTKAKADSAYKTIVGVENRDPSVVHWQEGNTVTVRVFPVLDNEERQFKLGITAPLSLEHGALIYRNIYFDGPVTSSTGEDVEISFETPPADLQKGGIFSKEKDGRLTASGPYSADWQLSFKDEGLVHQLFSANGKVFSVTPYRKELATADISDVYLDVNSVWSKNEYNTVLSLLGHKRVWVYIDEMMEQVTEQNRSELFKQAAASRFSLFPFFKISQPSTAIVISKGVVNSPSVDDLENTRFMDALKGWLAGGQHVMLYNLGGELSPYLRTLKECRTFRYDQGDIAALKALLDAHRFPASIENDQRIVIESAGMTINETPGTEVSTAPDHLQRLFAYNHIMHAMGPRLLTGGNESDTLVAEAAESYIVTPLSSLVVLEKQEDYDRFNIKESNNSLKNASLKSKGAVPEPHEWALIVIGLLLIVYLKFRPVLFKRVAAI